LFGEACAELDNIAQALRTLGISNQFVEFFDGCDQFVGAGRHGRLMVVCHCDQEAFAGGVCQLGPVTGDSLIRARNSYVDRQNRSNKALDIPVGIRSQQHEHKNQGQNSRDPSRETALQAHLYLGRIRR
jgi:hypothetical protein